MASAMQANGQVSSEILAGVVTYPQSVIDSWPPANFVNPTLHPPTIIIYSAIFGTLALASTIGRLWSRFKVQGNGGVDDWCFMASLPFSFPLVFMTINACSRFYNKVFGLVHNVLFSTNQFPALLGCGIRARRDDGKGRIPRPLDCTRQLY